MIRAATVAVIDRPISANTRPVPAAVAITPAASGSTSWPARLPTILSDSAVPRTLNGTISITSDSDSAVVRPSPKPSTIMARNIAHTGIGRASITMPRPAHSRAARISGSRPTRPSNCA